MFFCEILSKKTLLDLGRCGLTINASSSGVMLRLQGELRVDEAYMRDQKVEVECKSDGVPGRREVALSVV
jgi:hypothetical protein